jgi:crotonobetainyl-CoA:carnitine CoA-transferase CaiB-like acyl-CoA transferase
MAPGEKVSTVYLGQFTHEHAEEILKELGYDDGAVARLRQAGAV